MSVLRSCVLLVALVLLAVVAGCGGTAAPGTSASVGAVATPTPISQPPGDGGAGATNPPITAGEYTSGSMHFEVSGDINATFDIGLVGGFSDTTSGTTLLTYTDEASGNTGGVVISPGGNGITLTTTSVSAVGGDTVGGDTNVCSITVAQSDASRLAGTFDCRRLLGVVAATSQGVTIDMRGTFEASR